MPSATATEPNGHNEFAQKHMEECQQLYLMFWRFTAVRGRLEMDFMEEYFSQQVVPDCYHDPKMWWEVHGPDDGGAGSGRRMGTDRCRHASGIWRRERMFMCDKVIQEIIRQPLTNPP